MLLDVLLTNKEGLTGDMKVDGSFRCSDHEMVEFSIGDIRRGERESAKLLPWASGGFELFRILVGRVPWDSALKSKGVHKGWSLLKKEVLCSI